MSKIKTTLLGLALAAVALAIQPAQAADAVGACVFPKTKPGKGGRLEFKTPIVLRSAPDEMAMNPKILTAMQTFAVKAERNGFIQLATVPDYDKADPAKDAGKLVGWARRSDFDAQELRNCN